MKIPDNFILIIVAGIVAFGSYFIPETSKTWAMLNGLWTVLLVMISPGGNIMPKKDG